MEWVGYIILLELVTLFTPGYSFQPNNNNNNNPENGNGIILERQQIPWLSEINHYSPANSPSLAQQDYYYESLKTRIDNGNEANNETPVLVNSLFLEKISAASKAYINTTELQTTQQGTLSGRPRILHTIPLPVVNRPFQVSNRLNTLVTR